MLKLRLIYIVIFLIFQEQLVCINTVKKQLNATEIFNSSITKNESNITPHKTRFDRINLSYSNDLPESVRSGFYILIAFGMIALLFIAIRAYGLRSSRAERKYGVCAQSGAQELTPLPMAADDDSENDDHTVFDINKQIRVP